VAIGADSTRVAEYSYTGVPLIFKMSPTNRPRILSTGNDAMLLHSRKLVLEHAGFDVLTCSPEDALEKLQEEPDTIQAAVLGQSVKLDERLSLAQEMRQISPNLAIVMMHYPEDRFDASLCDTVVETLSAPEVLARAVTRALKKRERL
jgi:DNA-binding response OmpR family regulator